MDVRESSLHNNTILRDTGRSSEEYLLSLQERT